jgi:hypothetical protein
LPDGDELRLPVPDDHHRVLWRASPFSRASGVHDPDPGGPRHFWHVTVAVGDEIACGEKLAQPFVPPDGRTPVVDEADPKPFELGRRPHGKGGAELAVVHVPLNGGHRSQALEVGEHRSGREVAGVDDRIRSLENPEAVRGKRARAAREMRVSQERDQ